METQKKIGIKYCGGCNPAYDRVELIKQIKLWWKDKCLFFRYDEQNLDGLLVINGCPRACAIENLNHMRIDCLFINGENDWGNSMDWLKTLNGKGCD